jgi:hypothetical protein
MDANSLNGEANLTFDGSTLGVTGNITVTGNVDGVDILATSSSLSTRVTTNETDITNLQTDSGSFSTRVTTNETNITSISNYTASLPTNLDGLTDAEVTQLQNIDSSTISTTQ